MVKFFKRGPKKCSICGQEKPVYKHMQKGITKLDYCRECYDSFFSVVEKRVKDQIEAKIKAGQKIGMRDALAITKEISEEIEGEQARKVEEDIELEKEKTKKKIFEIQEAEKSTEEKFEIEKVVEDDVKNEIGVGIESD